MKLRNILILMICVFTVTQICALNLKLKNVARINNGTIRLQDLVESHDGDSAIYQRIRNTVIDQLPYDKRMINLKSNEIADKIRQNHPNTEFTLSSNLVAVRWEEIFLSADIVQKEAINFVRRYYRLGENADITILNIPRLAIPNDNITLSFEKSKFSENTNMIRLNGQVLSQNNVINVFHVLAKIEVSQDVFQANRSIKKGEKLTKSDFMTVKMNINPNSNFSLKLDENDEMIASRFISKGSILKNTDIQRAPAVKRNEVVTVVIRGNAMQINYEALSRADGWIGDRILMQNLESRQTFRAEVIDKNTVLVTIDNLPGETNLTLNEKK